MPKLLLALTALVALLVISTEALARSPAIYNVQGNLVGVIQRFTPDGSAIMQPIST